MLDPVVCTTVNKTKQLFESNNELIDTLLAEISTQDREKQFYYDEKQDSPEVNEQENTEQESSFIVQMNEINKQPEKNYII